MFLIGDQGDDKDPSSLIVSCDSAGWLPFSEGAGSSCLERRKGVKVSTKAAFHRGVEFPFKLTVFIFVLEVSKGHTENKKPAFGSSKEVL